MCCVVVGLFNSRLLSSRSMLSSVSSSTSLISWLYDLLSSVSLVSWAGSGLILGIMGSGLVLGVMFGIGSWWRGGSAVGSGWRCGPASWLVSGLVSVWVLKGTTRKCHE